MSFSVSARRPGRSRRSETDHPPYSHEVVDVATSYDSWQDASCAGTHSDTLMSAPIGSSIRHPSPAESKWCFGVGMRRGPSEQVAAGTLRQMRAVLRALDFRPSKSRRDGGWRRPGGRCSAAVLRFRRSSLRESVQAESFGCSQRRVVLKYLLRRRPTHECALPG
jgi:hypothetical protein